jgi:hypothetical protein
VTPSAAGTSAKQCQRQTWIHTQPDLTLLMTLKSTLVPLVYEHLPQQPSNSEDSGSKALFRRSHACVGECEAVATVLLPSARHVGSCVAHAGACVCGLAACRSTPQILKVAEAVLEGCDTHPKKLIPQVEACVIADGIVRAVVCSVWHCCYGL